MQNIKEKIKILIVEPFYSGSHRSWVDNYSQYSLHDIDRITLKGVYWKWRMHGGAITLAEKFNKYLQKNKCPDVILTTDMLNLPVFISFIKIKNIPIVTFFHENQLTYPWSTQDRDKKMNRDHHYGFINYTTALGSNLVMYNSNFHKNSFIYALKKFLKQFPDHNGLNNVHQIEKKSNVSYLGLALSKFDKYKVKSKNKVPLILWNHRWEYDKNPSTFFKMLKKIKELNIPFKLVILGEQFSTEMDEFTQARNYFTDEIVHIGYADSFEEYAKWLWKSDFIPVTSNQEFFGASVMEAVYCRTIPILPNRLTYPELFSRKLFPYLFYENENDLESKMIDLIQNEKKVKLDNLHKLIVRYDWQNIAPRYDKIIYKTFLKNKI